MGKSRRYQGGFPMKHTPAAVRPLATVNAPTTGAQSPAPTLEEPFDWVGERVLQVFPSAHEITEDPPPTA